MWCADGTMTDGSIKKEGGKEDVFGQYDHSNPAAADELYCIAGIYTIQLQSIGERQSMPLLLLQHKNEGTIPNCGLTNFHPGFHPCKRLQHF